MEAATARPQNEDSLGIAIGVSIALHVVVFAVLALRAVFYPTEPLVLEDAIHVDMVALPDKGIKTEPLPPMATPPPEAKPPEPEVKEIPKPPEPVAKPAPPKPETPVVNLNKTKKAEDSALKRLEAMEKIEKMMKEEKSAPTAAPAPRPQVIKGNEISHGNALKGLARLEQQSYLQNIDGVVKSHWNLPAWMTNANLSARAQIFVDAQGNVVKKVLTKSSGNATYDERVLAAIDASSPLPAPPADLANIVAVDGIELGFPE